MTKAHQCLRTAVIEGRVLKVCAYCGWGLCSQEIVVFVRLKKSDSN
eukprot:COSAG05_NODE_594_length_8461_cov_4.373475_4_plen_46_part_00